MKTVLYSNFYDSDRFDEVKQYLAEEVLECELDEVSDDQVWDQLNWEDQYNWEDLECELKRLDQRAPAFILSNACYTRYPELYGSGTRYGLRRVENIMDAFYDLGDYIEVYQEDGRLFCHYAHHDGGGTFEIKVLNRLGNDAYEKWNYSNAYNDKSEWEMLHLLNSLNFYSHRIDIDAAA